MVVCGYPMVLWQTGIAYLAELFVCAGIYLLFPSAGGGIRPRPPLMAPLSFTQNFAFVTGVGRFTRPSLCVEEQFTLSCLCSPC